MSLIHGEAGEKLTDASKQHEDTDSQVDYSTSRTESISHKMLERRSRSLQSHKMSEKSMMGTSGRDRVDAGMRERGA